MTGRDLLVPILAAVTATACASIKQYQTVRQPIDRDLQTYVGGTILKMDREESLPNAFGGADVYGGRRQKGSVELKYLGPGKEGVVKLRVFATDISTTEDWRRRLGNKGTVTSSSDAVDFEHPINQLFEMEGVSVRFLKVDTSGVIYRLSQWVVKR
jgi:hypothetical protein